MNTWLICFDIEDDNIRTRVGKALLEYGERVQRSVFEVVLRNETELDSLLGRVEELAGDETDVRIYRVCADCRRVSRTLTREPVMRCPAAIIL